MNEPKSNRYHRLKRRADGVAFAATVAVLGFLAWWRPALPLWQSVLLVVLLTEAVALPASFYRTFLLDRKYELSTEPASAWIRDHLKAFGITTAFGLAGAEFVYALIRWSPAHWWWMAALGAAAVTMLLARLAPVILLPLFYSFKPLERASLTDRLMTLSRKAGVPVLGVYEWALGAKTRRANAALAGAGGTRRILLSDTLLTQYSDDEIEVILAHELAHHVHHDIPKALAVEFVLLLAAFLAASVAIDLSVGALALAGPSDPRGLPVLLLAGGAVMLAATPLVNWLSRENERRADAYALSLTSRREAFVSALRRLATQNLVEESPSRAAVLLFHTHPPIEERIAAARHSR